MKVNCSITRDEYIMCLMLDSMLEGLHYCIFPSCNNSMLDDLQNEIDSCIREGELFYE